MIRLLTRFFDDIHAIATSLNEPMSVSNIARRHITVELSQKDRDLLANYRRYKARVKV